MTKEEKTLLIQDLCSRLPYGVKIRIEYPFYEEKDMHPEDFDGLDLRRGVIANTSVRIEEIKPYLRPMSSMTDEEWRKMHNCCNAILMGDKRICIQKSKFGSFSELQDAYTTIDWLNKHHFDYRGLIGKGLALPAPQEMYDN